MFSLFAAASQKVDQRFPTCPLALNPAQSRSKAWRSGTARPMAPVGFTQLYSLRSLRTPPNLPPAAWLPAEMIADLVAAPEGAADKALPPSLAHR